MALDQEEKHGRDTLWDNRTKQAPRHNNQASSAFHQHPHHARTLLLLIPHRWSIDNEWHWARHTQLGEDADRYAKRTGVELFSFLRTMVMNLLHPGGHRSIRLELIIGSDNPGVTT